MSRKKQNMEDVDVLIVGARPVGLLLGAELQRDGVGVCVINRIPARDFFCKALGISPSTVEILYDLGIADRAIQAGVWLTGVETWVDGAMVPARARRPAAAGLSQRFVGHARLRVARRLGADG
jgi:2-polyprenyl-6-methoxyphenol hydroxylase-like FAD-dependent oxidoreductase